MSLQTRLDEKEYKSREIADSFRDFKREVCAKGILIITYIWFDAVVLNQI